MKDFLNGITDESAKLFEEFIVPASELKNRLSLFFLKMEEECPDWDTAIIINNVNQYYFTGTMQDGLLIIKRDHFSALFVHKSYPRAKAESFFSPIFSMQSYRDVAEIVGKSLGTVYLETNVITLQIFERLQKAFNISATNSIDLTLLKLRSVKSQYELDWMIKAGIKQKELFQLVPSLLREGISEAEFAADFYRAMIKLGHHGVSRFSGFQNEFIGAQICFGASSAYPVSLVSPAGHYGGSPAVPLLGNKNLKLRTGDLIYIDSGFGLSGYHSDKTRLFCFNSKFPRGILSVYKKCREIMLEAASMLKPGAIPSEIFRSITEKLPEEFLIGFMNTEGKKVNFLGHGIGLQVDEYPIIAKGFDEPLKENMVVAFEPKKNLPGIGTIGCEDTFLVTASGGKCLTE